MSAPVEILPPPAQFDAPAAQPPLGTCFGYAGPRAARHDGWTADRQRAFLIALSEGATVKQACVIVNMTKQSAYALRGAAHGAGFALGWEAALLRGREALADELMTRAMDGVVDTYTDADGNETTRHRHDNALAMKLLNRLDRLADSAHRSAASAAARLVATDFDQYVDLIARGGGPARAGMFLAARLDAPGVRPADDDDLAPIRALARADRWLRTHTDLADPVATDDLDPAERAGWSAAQWARAEAAGLVRLAPEPAPEPAAAQDDETSQFGQLSADPLDPDDEPVWYDDAERQWCTHFPPPPGFLGHEEGEFGDPAYWRLLSDAEEELVKASMRAQADAAVAREGPLRDMWFARLAHGTAAIAGSTAAGGLDSPPPSG